MKSHVPVAQDHAAAQPQRRTAAAFHDASPRAQALQRLRLAGASSPRVTQLLSRQAMMTAAAPVVQCLIGQIPESARAVKTRRSRAYSKTQKYANEMRTIMDDAETKAEAAVEDSVELPLLRNDNQIDADRRSLIASLNDARGKEYWILQEPHTVGIPRDAGVTETLNYRGGWEDTIMEAITTIQDNLTGLSDSLADGAPDVANLGDNMPNYFAELARTGKLTLKLGSRRYGGANAGTAYYFNETDDWCLHVHHSKTSASSTAHYKPVDDELGVGYQATNYVLDTTLIRLGAFK